ncbi:MAG: glycolate oxidase subunit GlcE [Gammaproteobacteria bacterium]|nr:glycolate oxidase subunit GlcE [Gammaproteobacteria bacterium]
MIDNDISHQIQHQLEQAVNHKTPVKLCAGNSKNFYGRKAVGDTLDMSAHRGVINYEPTELVITVRAGTPLKELQQILDAENQTFGFEPPSYGDTATIGGTIACNLSGPRRAFAGSARDFVLGSKIINGKAEQLHFGGEVMKNVAGYDVSRLMCGAMGTLGALLELSIKVIPKPESELTLVHELTATESLKKVHQFGRQALPISATCFDANKLYFRLSGSAGALTAARKLIGGDEVASGDNYWQQLKEQQSTFFKTDQNIWRLSLVSNAPILNLSGKTLYEWNGAQRWLVSDEDETVIRNKVAKQGGHAVCFRQHKKTEHVFHPLETGLFKMHRQLKQAFDPDSLLNPGRIYADL